MASMQTNHSETQDFRVVHPMDDEPEIKRSTENLGPIAMTASVRISLMVLRAYLTGMTLMLAYHVLDLAGVFGK
jgi:hypothetical protein